MAAMIQKRTMILVSDQPLQLEMVVDRRHEEHPPVEDPEAEHLDHHAERLDHEQAADEQQTAPPSWWRWPSAARAAPRASDPVSPMNTLAGCVLYQRKPTRGAGQAHGQDGQVGLALQEGDARVGEHGHGHGPAARPSRPSVRLTACENPAISKKAKT